MRNRNKAGSVVGTIYSHKVWVTVATLQSTNDMHPPVCITSEAIGHLVYELSKLRVRAHNLMDF